MKFVIENAPSLFYILGSLCFIIGTILNMIRSGA